MNDINRIIAEREKTHGNFPRQAKTAQSIKEVMRYTDNWEFMPEHQKEALELIATKLSRILNGNPAWHDTWHDIAGYAVLVANTLEAHHE
jgi:hypothetical protein